MAYRALVGCASAFGATHTSASFSSSSARGRPEEESVSEGDAYAWFCVDLLLTAIHNHSSRTHTKEGKEHRRKLLLALISTVSAVPLRLLPRLLGEVETLLNQTYCFSAESARASDNVEDEREREEVTKVLFEELLNVGDEEKEYVISWWGACKGRLRLETERCEGGGGMGKKKGLTSRL